MKSNEEFIAGIYKKAAVYTEEKETKVVKVNFAARAAKIAAMVVVCIGLAGVGMMTLGLSSGRDSAGTQQPGENYGIALTSETGEDFSGAAQLRIMPVAETVTFTGVVKEISAEENRIWLSLSFDETAPEYAEGSVVCIRWDMLETISDEIKVGTKLTATGALSMYENESSGYHGCAELVLTDKENLLIR